MVGNSVKRKGNIVVLVGLRDNVHSNKVQSRLGVRVCDDPKDLRTLRWTSTSTQVYLKMYSKSM